MPFLLLMGNLLHKMPWAKKSSFKNNILGYVTYVEKHFGKCMIVFDGYKSSNTKDMTHIRRSNGKIGTKNSFTEDMMLCVAKESFLSNKTNKHSFINF